MKLIISILTIIYTANAQAGLLVEPIIGYNITGVKYKTASATLGTAAQGLVYGGRLGFVILDTIFIAADYTSGELSWEPEGAVQTEIDAKLTRFGITAGMDVPVLPLRVWAGSFKSDFSADNNIAGKYDFSDGDGIKLGVGLTFLPFIDINFEYYTAEYDTYKIGGTTQNFTAEDKGAMLSLSAPFNL